MFVKALITSFRFGAHAPGNVQAAFRVQSLLIRENCALRVTACAARAHLLVASSSGHAAAVRAGGVSKARGARGFAVNPLRRACGMALRAVLRAAYIGNPLTPAGYAIVAMTVAAVALAAMLSASSFSNELDSALRVSGLFS